jgi:ring-1,2-phenylacetyl-CoA epoxidase subunit PaaE
MLTRDAMLIEFRVPDELAGEFKFVPGQHVTVRATIDGREERRSYSICSVPGEALSVVVKLVPEGLFSAHLHELAAPGVELEVMPPSGHFLVDIEPELTRHHLAIAAGSGITPIMSMLRTILEHEPSSSVTLLYGNRASSSVIFRQALSDLKDRYLTRLTVLHVLSREPQQVPLFDGRIDGAKIAALCQGMIDAPQLAGAYLCGPHSMIEASRNALREAGLAPERIRSELFSTGEVTKPRPRVVLSQAHCQVTIRQDGVTRQFEMPESGVSVLDAALAHGIDLPYSCKSGVCSTCRAKCVQGEVEMDANFALEDYEVAQGFVLSCQSFPTTPVVELDYDAHT